MREPLAQLEQCWIEHKRYDLCDYFIMMEIGEISGSFYFPSSLSFLAILTFLPRSLLISFISFHHRIYIQHNFRMMLWYSSRKKRSSSSREMCINFTPATHTRALHRRWFCCDDFSQSTGRNGEINLPSAKWQLLKYYYEHLTHL